MIALSNTSYKLAANAHQRHKEFKVRDYMMVCICPKHYPKHAVKKLHARSIGPFQIVRRLGSNAYLLDLPPNLFISLVLNVSELSLHHGTFSPPIIPSFTPISSAKLPCAPSFGSIHDDVIMDIMV